VSDRTYRTLLGLLLLVSLYFELSIFLYSIILILFIEGITNFRIPGIVCAIRKCVTKKAPDYVNMELVPDARFNIESERVWRIVVGAFLLLGYALNDSLWFLPWFMGFAIFGAGLSGVCPVLLAIRWLGFK